MYSINFEKSERPKANFVVCQTIKESSQKMYSVKFWKISNSKPCKGHFCRRSEDHRNNVLYQFWEIGKTKGPFCFRSDHQRIKSKNVLWSLTLNMKCWNLRMDLQNHLCLVLSWLKLLMSAPTHKIMYVRREGQQVINILCKWICHSHVTLAVLSNHDIRIYKVLLYLY